MCGCSHTLLNIFWLGTEGDRCTLWTGSYNVLRETQQLGEAVHRQGRGERSEKAERDDYFEELGS